jgi:hypothetical protein
LHRNKVETASEAFNATTVGAAIAWIAAGSIEAGTRKLP